MSKMKKVISLVLCIAMLAGTFTFLGDLMVPKADAAEGSNVKTYAEIDAQYDKFVYVGVDVYEVANGELTDGYVQPGDWLEYHMTVYSDMYVGATYPVFVFEKDFFDVRVVTCTTPRDHDNYANSDYEGNIKQEDGTNMNPDHPWAAPNEATYHTITAFPATKQLTNIKACEVDASVYENWDLVKSNVGITTTVNNTVFPMTADTWITSWYARVKEGLANGETGKSFSPENIWINQVNPDTGKGDTRRFANVSTSDTKVTFSKAKTLAARFQEVTLLVDDCTHEFTIGEGKPVEKKAVTFQNLDGTVISTAEYAEGETVEVPAVDGLLTWTEAGKAVELGTSFTMAQKALTYVAVLSTDEFNVTINLNGGAFAEDAVLPEGATVADGKLVIKAGFNEEIKLSDLPTPERTGYTGTWDPATVKVENTRGANASIKWTPVTYTAKFYLDKEAYESGAAAAREISFVYGNKIPFANVVVTKPELKFANWINAATGEVANAETIYADNMVFYGDWTEFNGTATIWGRDYENGTWKALAVKKADAGSVIKINELKALVTEANYGVANVQYVVAGPESTYDTNKAYRTDIKMVEGTQDIYLFTEIKFNITLKTPEVDENGYMIDSYTETTATANSDMAKEDALTIANPLVEAPKAQYPGYTFVGWEAEDGTVYEAGNIALDAANGTDYTFTAKYEETVYTVEFVVNYDTALKEVILAQETFTIGDTFDLDEMTLVKEVVKTEEEGDDDTTGEGDDDTTTEGDDDTTTEGGDDTTTGEGDDTTTEGGDDDTTGEGDDTTDEEVPEEEKVTYEPAILPEIDKENREQAGGPYRNVDGYKFIGWKSGTQADKFVEFNIDETFELTPNKVKELTFNDKIVIKGFWEGLYYDFIARYATELDAEGKPIYISMDPIQVQTGASLDQYYAAALEKVNEKLPEGRRFTRWRLNDGTEIRKTAPSKMVAYGTTVEAYYLGAPLSVYIDYNYGTEKNPLTLEDTMSLSALYSRYVSVGVDVENDIPEGELASVAQMIRMSGATESTSPGTNYEIVGWKIFYVENEEDVYKRDMWKEGISDISGSTIAKYTLIFQTEWMAHTDFFFRVYNTNGALRSALDKNFKTHFWYMDNPVEKEKAMPLNALPDRLIILGFMPKFEFESGFSIRIDPISLSKAWLNPANWGALIKALIGGLSSGFGGAI